MDDDEREHAMATEMRGPDEPTNATGKHQQLTHIPFQSMVRTMRARTSARPTASKTRWGTERRGSHSNRVLLHESEATR